MSAESTNGKNYDLSLESWCLIANEKSLHLIDYNGKETTTQQENLIHTAKELWSHLTRNAGSRRPRRGSGRKGAADLYNGDSDISGVITLADFWLKELDPLQSLEKLELLAASGNPFPREEAMDFARYYNSQNLNHVVMDEEQCEAVHAVKPELYCTSG